jgi:hypothetical protein
MAIGYTRKFVLQELSKRKPPDLSYCPSNIIDKVFYLSWKGAVEKALASGRSQFRESTEIVEVLNILRLGLTGVVHGPKGSTGGLNRISMMCGLMKFSTSECKFNAVPLDLKIERIGYASWNVCAFLRFDETPAVWRKEFPGANWVVITSAKHAFIRWDLFSPTVLHTIGMPATLEVFRKMVEKVDGTTSDDYQVP